MNTPQRSCYRKKQYISEDEARRAARQVQPKVNKPLREYPCYFCGFWHIGEPLRLPAQPDARANGTQTDPSKTAK